MARPAFELADIFLRSGEPYRREHRLTRQQLRAMRAIEVCRTAALGGHVEKCSQCEYSRIAYNSCRNRHCPKCQNAERAQWLLHREAELLPAEYFHVVFTLPEPVACIAFHNQELVYGILFRSAARTLLTLARDPKHLGAEIGFFAVLHTWGQNLLYHPHVHCVVPGGGLSADYDRWVSCRPGFFLPVKVLSRLFRRLFLEELEKAFAKKQLRFFSELEQLKDPDAFRQYLTPLRAAEWVVYAKPPFGGAQRALAYLSRYTHRTAISNQRLLGIDNGAVTFQWKDYRSPARQKSRHDAGRRRVYPALSAACAATRLSAYSLLRVPRQPSPQRETGAVPQAHRRIHALAGPGSGTMPTTAEHADPRSAATGAPLSAMRQRSDDPAADRSGIPLAGEAARYVMIANYNHNCGFAFWSLRRTTASGSRKDHKKVAPTEHSAVPPSLPRLNITPNILPQPTLPTVLTHRAGIQIP